MRNYDVILFDLDGTLTDSAPGILNSVRYACRKLGLPVPGEETLRRFLGPPLIASFRELMGLDAAGADRAVSAFREYFPTKGLFENEVYPGVPALLADLKAAGKTVHVGGNIGNPLLCRADEMHPEDYAVLELSSFQLMTMTHSPHIAVVTNLAPNHLDMHKSMEEYVAAKENIFRY